MQSLVLTSPEELRQIIREELETLSISHNHEAKHQEEEQYLSAKETAQMLGISRPTLYRWMESSIIPYIRIGSRLLFPKRRIHEVLNEKTKKRRYSN